MARKSYMAETLESAYQTWRKCGQNVELTCRELEKQGYRISKPTIYDWMEKYNWKDRAARVEAEERKAADAVMSAEQEAISCLEKMKKRYDTYFENLGDCKIDNVATPNYINTIKAITDIKMKAAAFKTACYLDFMKDLIEWLSKNDPDTVAAIERDFDDFVAYAREKYGA